MNTDTGRVYDPEEYERRMADFWGDLDKHQVEFRKAHEAGKIVPISAAVARQVQTGQRVADRRRRRKAAKAARRANRGR